MLWETTKDLKLNHWNAVNSEQIPLVEEKGRVDSLGVCVSVENWLYPTDWLVIIYLRGSLHEIEDAFSEEFQDKADF